MKTPPIPSELIKKYLRNTCTEKEVVLVNQWYNSFEHDEDIIEQFSDQEKEQLKATLFNKIVDRPEFDNAIFRRRTNKIFSFRNAAILSGVAAALLIVFNFVTNIDIEKTTPREITPAVADIIKVNRSKNIEQAILPDGSLIWLSPNAKLVYPQKFDGANREVKMEGEAFFEITRDPKHPFVIYGNGVITKVLGTSFRIRGNPSQPTEVSVLTGKVSVKIASKDASEVVLMPHQKVLYLASKSVLKTIEEPPVSTIHIWEKATMSFENKKLTEVLIELNKAFKTNISTENDNELGNYIFTADFADMNLASILEIMGKSLNVDYEVQADKILLKKKN